MRRLIFVALMFLLVTSVWAQRPKVYQLEVERGSLTPQALVLIEQIKTNHQFQVLRLLPRSGDFFIVIVGKGNDINIKAPATKLREVFAKLASGEVVHERYGSYIRNTRRENIFLKGIHLGAGFATWYGGKNQDLSAGMLQISFPIGKSFALFLQGGVNPLEMENPHEKVREFLFSGQLTYFVNNWLGLNLGGIHGSEQGVSSNETYYQVSGGLIGVNLVYGRLNANFNYAPAQSRSWQGSSKFVNGINFNLNINL